jgi:magnesium-transporting ATPase (P-type)
MTWDKKMESKLINDDGSPPTIISMRANNTNLNEEMAQLDYIFSDKTGTFTKNEMKLARWFVDDVVYDEMNESGSMGVAMIDVSSSNNATGLYAHLRSQKLQRYIGADWRDLPRF